MSEESKVASGDENPQAVVAEVKEEFVSKKAYEEVTKDMHKFKSKAKEMTAAKVEYEAKLNAIKEDQLKEQEKWKELYENTKAESEKYKADSESEKAQRLTGLKRSALKQELGNVKDVYLSHANIDSIELNEHGLVDKDTLVVVANQFREEHGALLTSSAGGNPTSAPAHAINPQEKSLSDMSIVERQQLLKQMKTK